MAYSTRDSGYILSLPKLPNPATSDPAYQRILAWYLPTDLLETIQPRLEKFGEEAVSDRINELIANAERDQPYIKGIGRWGISNGFVRSSA